jgi:WD40 repeat protein
LPSYLRLLETKPSSNLIVDGDSDQVSNDVEQNDQQHQVRSRVLSGHSSTISDICVLREGINSSSKVAFSSASMDGTVRLWDSQTGESLSTLCHKICNSGETQASGTTSSQQHGGRSSNTGSSSSSSEVGVLAVDATKERSPILYSGSSDGSLWSWDVALGKMTKRISQAHSGPITSLTVAPMETSKVVTGSSDNTVKVWDMRQKRPLVYTLRGHSAPITSLEVEPVWGRIFSGSRDQSLRVWDIRTGRQTHALQDHFGSVQCVVTSPYTLKGYVSGARDSSIKFWNMDGQCMKTIRAHKGVVYDMALQPISDTGAMGNLMVGSDGVVDNGVVDKFDDSLMSSQMEDTMVSTTRGSFLGPLLASGGADGKIRLWDCTRKKCVSELEGHRGPVYSCKWANSECVVSASADSTVRAWDINSGRSLTLTGHTSAVTHIHCDQDCILSASKDATLRLWSVGIAFGL